MIARVILTAILCGFIGLEREMKQHPAGFRTHLLVGVGACLMMLLSLYGFEEYLDDYSNVQFDPARIPSYVISGIGFLGAGTIMVKGATIKGLTTAASIWIVAGLGLVIGAGMYSIALFTTFVVLLSLIFLNKMELVMNRNSERKLLKVVIRSKAEHIEKVVSLLHQKNLTVHKMQLVSVKKDKEYNILIHYLLEIDAPAEKSRLMFSLLELEEVEKIM
ncbi:MgtC/SapB family protein [Metabacillus arenae]